jgi:iron complex transport system permease protein
MKSAGVALRLTVASLLALAGAALIGPTPLAPGDALAALVGAGSAEAQIIVLEIRLPRALTAFVVGAALGLSGAALQGLLRNPLAEPGVLGVSSLAALGAAGTIAFGLFGATPLAVATAAVAGAALAVSLLAIAASRGVSTTGLILVGVGVSSFGGALLALIMNLAPNPFTVAELINWMLGSAANRSLADLAVATPLMAIGGLLIAAAAKGLSALTLGEEAALSVGASVPRTRLLIIVGAGLATGAAVALAGIVGFVGLVAPHLVRGLVGHDPARSLWPASLLAGLLLVLADTAIRLAPGEAELKLGVVAALLGAPAFLALALRGERHGF